MVSKKLVKELVAQYNREIGSALIYKGMHAYVAGEGYDGMAHFMKLQAEEEYEHAEKFFDFINEIGAKVEVNPEGEIKSTYASNREVFELAYKHEQYVTESIRKLYKMAMEEEAFEVTTFLNWFVTEQVEEEDNFRGILDLYEKMEGVKAAEYYIDKELSHR